MHQSSWFLHKASYSLIRWRCHLKSLKKECFQINLLLWVHLSLNENLPPHSTSIYPTVSAELFHGKSYSATGQIQNGLKWLQCIHVYTLLLPVCCSACDCYTAPFFPYPLQLTFSIEPKACCGAETFPSSAAAKPPYSVIFLGPGSPASISIGSGDE